MRFIPTSAGNIVLSATTVNIPSVHPHECGEHRSALTDAVDDGGSSPRVRGTCAWQFRWRDQHRFIPTSAGNMLSEILACAVDTADWKDFKRDAPRPIGDVACSLGYDPAGTGDNSAVSIVTKPASVAEKFRLVRKEIMKGIKGPAQAARIEMLTDQFRIEDMEIDDTGVGITVGDFIEPIFPRVRRIRYNPEYKSRMVQKFQSILAARRFEYDEEDKTLPLAFMTVKQETTKNGVITYASSHSEAVGHGDEAWSTMHACMCEPLNPDRRRAMTIDFF